jgi:hypothetical protein
VSVSGSRHSSSTSTPASKSAAFRELRSADRKLRPRGSAAAVNARDDVFSYGTRKEPGSLTKPRSKRRTTVNKDSEPEEKSSRSKRSKISKREVHAEEDNAMVPEESFAFDETAKDDEGLLEDSLSVSNEEPDERNAQNHLPTTQLYEEDEASGDESARDGEKRAAEDEMIVDEPDDADVDGGSDEDESSMDENEFYDAEEYHAQDQSHVANEVVDLADSEDEEDEEEVDDHADSSHDMEEDNEEAAASEGHGEEEASSSDGDVEIVGENIVSKPPSAAKQNGADTAADNINLENASDLEMLQKIKAAVEKFGDRFAAVIAGQGSGDETSALKSIFGSSSAQKSAPVRDQQKEKENHVPSIPAAGLQESHVPQASDRRSNGQQHWNPRDSFVPSPSFKSSPQLGLTDSHRKGQESEHSTFQPSQFAGRLSATPYGGRNYPFSRGSSAGLPTTSSKFTTSYGYGSGSLTAPSPEDLLFTGGSSTAFGNKSSGGLLTGPGSTSKRAFHQTIENGNDIDSEHKAKRLSFGVTESWQIPVTPFTNSNLQAQFGSTTSKSTVPTAFGLKPNGLDGLNTPMFSMGRTSSPMRSTARPGSSVTGKLSDILVQPTMLPSSTVKRQTMSFLQRRRFEEQQQQANQQQQQLMLRPQSMPVVHPTTSGAVVEFSQHKTQALHDSTAPSAIVAKRILESLNELTSPMEEQRRKPTAVPTKDLLQRVGGTTSIPAPVSQGFSFAASKPAAAPGPSVATTAPAQLQKKRVDTAPVESSDKEFRFEAPPAADDVDEAVIQDSSDIKFVFSPPAKKSASAAGRPSVQTPKRPKSAMKESAKTPSANVAAATPKPSAAVTDAGKEKNKTVVAAPASSTTATEASNAPAQDSVWARAMAASADSVKCTACLVPNSKSAKICVSCETPLPGAGGSSSSGNAASAGGASSASSGTTPSSSSISSSGFSFGGKPTPTTTTTGAAATGGFTFGSTAPAAAVSTGGFTFGGPSSAATGDAAAKAAATGDAAAKAPAPTGGFSFGSTPSAGSASTAAPASAAGFSFGSTSASSSITSSSTAASSTVAPTAAASKAAEKVEVSPAKPPSSTTAAAPFTFGSSNVKNDAAVPAAKPSGGFSYSGIAAGPSDSASTTKSGTFAFGTTDKNKPSSEAAATAASVPSFQFGGSSTDDVPSSKKRSAGSDDPQPAKAPASSLGIFGAVTPVVPSAASTASTAGAPVSGFSFGGAGTVKPSEKSAATSAQPAAAATPFLFGASSTPAPAPAPAPASAPTSASTPFMFGASATTNKPATAAPAATPAPAVAPATTAAPFMFGASGSTTGPAPAPAQAPAPGAPFMFGASTGSAATKPAAAPAPFMFGAAPASSTAAATTTATTAPSTSFSFGATATTPKDTRSTTPPPASFQFGGSATGNGGSGTSSPGMVPDSPGSTMDLGYQSGDASNLSATTMPPAASSLPSSSSAGGLFGSGSGGIAFGAQSGAAPAFSFGGGAAPAATTFGVNKSSSSGSINTLGGSTSTGAAGSQPFMFGGPAAAPTGTAPGAGMFGVAPFGGGGLASSLGGGPGMGMVGSGLGGSGGLGGGMGSNMPQPFSAGGASSFGFDAGSAGGFSAGTSGGFSAGASGNNKIPGRKFVKAKLPTRPA